MQLFVELGVFQIYWVYAQTIFTAGYLNVWLGGARPLPTSLSMS
jgi:hypothetical protein